jgi:undecaprenyl-diphosphatase
MANWGDDPRLADSAVTTDDAGQSAPSSDMASPSRPGAGRRGFNAAKVAWSGQSPLLPRPARRPTAAVLAACVLITLVIGILVAHQSRADSLDRTVDSWIRSGLAGHGRTLFTIHHLGESVSIVILTLAVIIGCLAARRINGALLALISVPLAIVLIEVLKPLFHRTLDGFAVYPSGHTGSVFAVAAVVAVLLIDPARGKISTAARIAIVAVMFLVGCAVGVAMIGLNFHYFSDTIGGAAVGVGTVLATTFLLDRVGRFMGSRQDPGTRQ